MTEFDITVNALRNQGLNSDEILVVLSGLFQKTERLNQDEKTVDEKVRELLKQLGLPNNLGGYDYCVTAIKLCKEKGNRSFSKTIYPEVARIHQTTTSRVSSQIRNAIVVMADRCPQEVFSKVFGNTVSPQRGIPSSKEFITVLAASV